MDTAYTGQQPGGISRRLSTQSDQVSGTLVSIADAIYQPSCCRRSARRRTDKLLWESPSLIVRQATIADLDTLVPLFDAYRQFYEQPSDLIGARSFLFDRFEHQQSIIVLACEGTRAVGFVQLFPSFSSARLARTFILNDLFVSPDARGMGAARALLDGACEYGRRVGAARLSLSTAVTNTTAQSLYEKAGWTRDNSFYAYGIPLT